VVTFPDPMAVVATVKAALDINPNIEVVARVHRGREAVLLRELGVKELVSPEFESSFRILKRCLNIFGVESPLGTGVGENAAGRRGRGSVR